MKSQSEKHEELGRAILDRCGKFPPPRKVDGRQFARDIVGLAADVVELCAVELDYWAAREDGNKRINTILHETASHVLLALSAKNE